MVKVGADGVVGSPEPRDLDGFVSYSRRDAAAVLPFVAVAEAGGRSLWVDADDIPAGAPWRVELGSAIEASNTVICCLSPAWLASAECQREYDRALELRKRLIPILIQEVRDVPADLATLQWIDARTRSPSEVADAVLAAVDADYAGAREHTHWLARSLRWEALGAESSLLLRGRDLRSAEDWAARAGANPSPTPLQLAFIAASRKADRRRQRLVVIASLTTVAISVSLSIVALVQRSAAVEQREVAQLQQHIATSRLLDQRARELRADDPLMALMLGVAAQRVHDDAQSRAGLVGTLASTRMTHSLHDQVGAVSSVAVSPMNNAIASGSSDDGVTLWTTFGVFHLRGHGDDVTAVAFSPDAQLLASASADESVILWDVSDLRAPVQLGTPLLGSSDDVTALAFSPDGATVAAGSKDDTLRLWDISDPSNPTRSSRYVAGEGGAVTSVSFSADGLRLAIGRRTAVDRHAIALWDVSDIRRPTTTEPLFPGLDGSVTALSFSSRGSILASAGLDGEAIGDDAVTLWDMAHPAHPRRLSKLVTKGGDGVKSLALSHDGHTVATGNGDGTISLWNAVAPTRPTRLGQPMPGHSTAVTAVAFSANGEGLSSGSESGELLVWDVLHPAQPVVDREPLAGLGFSPWAVALSPDDHLVAAGDGHDLILWDVQTPGDRHRIGPILTGHSEDVVALAFSPDGRVLASGSEHSVILWDVADPARATRMGPALAFDQTVTSVAFDPHGTVLAVGGYGRAATLWDVERPNDPVQLAKLGQEGGQASSLKFTPDGHTMVGAAATGVALWDVTDPAHPRRRGPVLTGHGSIPVSVAISPDGATAAAVDLENTLVLWSIADPERPAQLGTALTGRSNNVGTVAFAPSGQLLVATGEANTVALWDVSDPSRPVRLGSPLSIPDGAVLDLAFSKNGEALATASYDGVRLWDFRTLNGLRDQPTQRACRITGRGLTPEEWARLVPGLTYEETCR